MPITQDRMMRLIDVGKKLAAEIEDKREKVVRVYRAYASGELSAENALESIYYEIQTSGVGIEVGMALGSEDEHFARMARINERTKNRTRTYRLKQAIAAGSASASAYGAPEPKTPAPLWSATHRPARTVPDYDEVERAFGAKAAAPAPTAPSGYDPPVGQSIGRGAALAAEAAARTRFTAEDPIAKGEIPGEDDLADL